MHFDGVLEVRAGHLLEHPAHLCEVVPVKPKQPLLELLGVLVVAIGESPLRALKLGCI